MQQQYSLLIDKLYTFIRRFYVDKILRGVLLFLIGVGSLFLLTVVTEYFGYFSTTIRTIVYFGFLVFSVSVFVLFILVPLLKLFNIGKTLTIEEAARILGKHFKSDVDDKILNTIQLQKLLNQDSISRDIINASIEQKSSRLIGYRFSQAVDLKKNIRFLPYVLILLMVIFSGWVLFPYIFIEPAERIINYDQVFERPAPFSIIFINEQPLRAIKNQPYDLRVKVDGKVLPANLEIIFKNRPVLMTKTSNQNFQYSFRSIPGKSEFYIRGGGFEFGPYTIEVVNRAVIKSFIVEATYPAYTRMEKQTFTNIGDIGIPEGTNLNWTIYTEDTDQLVYTRDSLMFSFEKIREGVFTLNQEVDNSFQYKIRAVNNTNNVGDSLVYFIRNITDNYPVINVQEYQDSIMVSDVFFKGIISDDYGFTGLNYQYRVFPHSTDEKDKPSFTQITIPFNRDELIQDFFYQSNLLELGMNPGHTIEYFFEVRDNDGINGIKSSRTQVFSINIKEYDELVAETVSSDEEVKTGLNENIAEIQTIQEQIDNLRRDMLNSENISWEQQQTLKELLEKQMQAQENFERLKEMSESNQTRQEQFNPQEQKIKEKQDELQKLFEEVLSDELKELYEQIQEELQKQNREKVFDLLNKMEFEMQDLESRLDRALELFKQLQVERMLSEAIKATERIKEQQDSLAAHTEKESIDENMIEEQKDIKEQFENLSELIDQMNEKNNELTRSNPLEDTGEREAEIQQQLEKAIEEMEKKNNNGSSQLQKNASEQLQQLGEQLKNMQAAMEQQNLAEDIRTLREILDNLVKTSFFQEQLMEEIKTINIRDPRYVTLIQQQRKINDDMKLIKDSLEALAKRQIQIEGIVSREIAEINLNIGQAIEHLVERRKQTGISRQQFVMTHVNNLALLLNESMQNMQMQMQGQGAEGESGNSSGAEGMQNLRQMQEQMNKMLEQMREGHQPQPGESGEGQMGMSEQLARMAAEQEAIRKRLQELNNKIGKDGSGSQEIEQIMREMERTELDIVTNNINRQTQLRQQRIVTRMLEHEKALMEREQESRRVGETAKFYEISNPQEFFEYNRNKNRAIDMLKSMPPGFKPHYKSLVELYFLNVQE